MIDARDAVAPVDLLHAVDRPLVQPLGLLARVLDLQTRFDVFDGRRYEADGRAGHDPRHGVPQRGQLVRWCLVVIRGGRDLAPEQHAEGRRRRGSAVGVEERLVEQPPVEGQRAEHDGVHEHPSHERRRGAFVQAGQSLFLDRLDEAL